MKDPIKLLIIKIRKLAYACRIGENLFTKTRTAHAINEGIDKFNHIEINNVT